MKKRINIIILLMLMLLPISKVEAASKTLQDYKNEVAALEAKKTENKRVTAATQSKIDAKRNAIISANNTITANENKVEKSKEEVIASQEQIKEKTDELSEIIEVLQYQTTDSGELYVDYIFESSSITQMMERESVIAQIADYTQDELNKLEELIDYNEKLQVQLANDNVNLENSITEYEQQVKDLEAYMDSLASIGLDYDEQIAAQKSLIKTFEAAGCKNTDSVDDCYYNKYTGSTYFSRPLTKGVVTQAWGNNGHKGIDLGGNAKGTAIYAPANGTVAHVAYKQSCGGNIIYIHHTIKGVAYTTEYGHLTAIYVKDGQYVTKGTIIGTVGGDPSTYYYDKCTAGTHLHYSVAYGYYLGSGKNGYSSWSKFTSNTKATGVSSISNFNNVRGWRWTNRG